MKSCLWVWVRMSWVCSRPVAYGDRTCVPAFGVGKDVSACACEQPAWKVLDIIDLT